AELHGCVDRDLERNDAPGNLVEACKNRSWIGDALRRRFHDHRIAWLWRRARRLRSVARRPRTGRQGSRRLSRSGGRPLRGLTRRGVWRNYFAGRGRAGRGFDVALAWAVWRRQVHWSRQRLRWRGVAPARVIRRRLLPG